MAGTLMLAKASIAWECTFLALHPRMMTPFVLLASAENTTQTSAKSASAATTTASRRFGMASLPLSPPGIMDPVMTTGTPRSRSMNASADAV
jgi:hypothetical protein